MNEVKNCEKEKVGYIHINNKSNYSTSNSVKFKERKHLTIKQCDTHTMSISSPNDQ